MIVHKRPFPETAKCIICGTERKIITSSDMQERDEMIYTLQLAAAGTQGFKKGYVCPAKPCLKVAGIDYKVVQEIMKELPDYVFRARKDMAVTVG